MDEFEAIASAIVDEAFNDLSRISEAMGEAGREEYGSKFPVRIWMVAGPSEDLSFAISAN